MSKAQTTTQIQAWFSL